MAAYNFWDCNLSASGHEYNSCKQRNISSVGIYLFTEISPSPMYISQPSGKEFRKGNYCTAENESWVKICKNTYKIRQTAQNNQAKLRSQVGKAQIPLRRLCDKVRDKSATSPRRSRGIVADTNHESTRYKSRRRLSWFVSATKFADFVADFVANCAAVFWNRNTGRYPRRSNSQPAILTTNERVGIEAAYATIIIPCLPACVQLHS